MKDQMDDQITFSMDIENGETRIRIRGDRRGAVIVRSAGGERIYLPPENFDQPASRKGGTSYESPYQDRTRSREENDGPYRRVEVTDSPYKGAAEPREMIGLEPTADGIKIRHPEPVEDIRYIR